MEKIFVQIASYRDNQLRHTIKDMLENAKNPERVIVGIAWQHSEKDEWDHLEDYKENPNFRILDIDYKDSKGVCWARNAIQQLYDNEEYTLQIDSHMRFIKDWDEELINMIKDLQKKGHKKPLLTAYASSFNPQNDPQERVTSPWRMNFDRFIPEGAVFFIPSTVPDWQNRKLCKNNLHLRTPENLIKKGKDICCRECVKESRQREKLAKLKAV
jgi:glycosyltransferase involved in cell wall biosynthesis